MRTPRSRRSSLARPSLRVFGASVAFPLHGAANHVGDLLSEFAEGMGFGLGFSVVEDLGARGEPGSVGEFGWGGAYHSTYWVDPQEDLVVVYFTQIIPTGGVDDHAKLRALVYQAIVDDDTWNR